MYSWNSRVRLLIVVSCGLIALPARAAVLDNFNSYTVGTVGTGATGGVWSAVGADSGNLQNESGNLLLTIGAATGNSGTFRALPSNIPDGTAATTVFMRLRANAATVNTSIAFQTFSLPRVQTTSACSSHKCG